MLVSIQPACAPFLLLLLLCIGKEIDRVQGVSIYNEEDFFAAIILAPSIYRGHTIYFPHSEAV